MSTQSITISSSSCWFRWLAKAILIAASISRVSYIIFLHLATKLVGPQYWEWEKIERSIPAVILTAVAWFAPIIGGILITLWLMFMWSARAISAASTGSILLNDPIDVVESILLAVVGVLSIVWGIRKRKRNV